MVSSIRTPPPTFVFCVSVTERSGESKPVR
jgi:hypothetical protein